MRAVKTNAFIWAALVVIIGLDERLALWAAIIGFLLAVVPLFLAPKLVPARNHENGHHADTLYRLSHPGQAPMPTNPLPGDNDRPSYTQGGWS